MPLTPPTSPFIPTSSATGAWSRTANPIRGLLRSALALIVAASVLLTGSVLASCGKSGPAADATEWTEEGMASYYGEAENGSKTASGEKYDETGMTAAHPTLAFGTIVRVTSLKNGKSVDVRINDHFPGTKGRVIDLSKGSFQKIAPLSAGIAKVRVEVLKWPDSGRRRQRGQ